jgi:hypothetical protein
MKRLSSVASIAALAFLLTACPLDFIEYGVTYLSPSVRADKKAAAVGETVTVTLSGNFSTVYGSPEPSYSVRNVELGACFIHGSGAEESQGGFCDQELPLPSWIQLSEDASHVKDFGELVVRTGQARKLRHTFRFTVTEPGEVLITTNYRILETPYPDSYLVTGGNNARVVFE